MDMRRTPGVAMVLPGIRARSNGQEAIDALSIGQAAPHAEEVGIERPRPLIASVQVAAGGVGLPDLQQRIRHRIATIIKDAARHDDTLADGLAARPALRVRSASSGVTALMAGPGPVNSDRVSGTSMSGSAGARRRVDWYASYRYGGKTSRSPRTISPIVMLLIHAPHRFLLVLWQAD